MAIKELRKIRKVKIVKVRSKPWKIALTVGMVIATCVGITYTNLHPAVLPTAWASLNLLWLWEV